MVEPKGDADLLNRAKVVGLYTLTGLIAFTIIVDALGRLLVDPAYETDSSIFVPLIAAWTGLMGLETAHLLRQRRDEDQDDRRDDDLAPGR